MGLKKTLLSGLVAGLVATLVARKVGGKGTKVGALVAGSMVARSLLSSRRGTAASDAPVEVDAE